MDGRGDINMDPDTRPIEAQVGTNEETGAGALGVLPVLSKHKKRMTNLSNSHKIIIQIFYLKHLVDS